MVSRKCKTYKHRFSDIKKKTLYNRESYVKHLMKWQCLNPFFENLVDSGASVKADCQFHLYAYNILTNSLIVNRLCTILCKNFV